MQKINLLFCGLLLVLITACSGSETYQGNWKALSLKGEKFDLSFDLNKFSVTDTVGDKASFDYTQNSVNITNGVRTYGIILTDGRMFEIHFPIPKNINTGVIKDASGNVIYTIGREKYVHYEDIQYLH